MDNVNNLNGVPNFGHGWDEEKDIPTKVEEVSIDEAEVQPEAKAKKAKKK